MQFGSFYRLAVIILSHINLFLIDINLSRTKNEVDFGRICIQIKDEKGFFPQSIKNRLYCYQSTNLADLLFFVLINYFSFVYILLCFVSRNHVFLVISSKMFFFSFFLRNDKLRRLKHSC